MGHIADAYDEMSAVGRSPDRAVTLTLSGRGSLRVELDPRVQVTHTEDDLGRQIAAAARVMIASFQQQQARAITTAMDEIRPA